MLTIKAQKRDSGVKTDALRKGGQIPAIFYGMGKDTTSISLSNIEFKKIWREAGESSAIKILMPEGDVDPVRSRPLEHESATVTSGRPASNGIDVLIHEVQTDPVTDEPIHVDFLAIDMKKKISVKVPLEFTGVAPAVKNGIGNLVKVLHEIEIEALPADLPHNLSVDISTLLGLENNILVSDIKLPSGVIAITKGDEVVASIIAQVEEKEEVAVPVDLSAIEVEKKGKKEEEAPTPEGVGVPTESSGAPKADKKTEKK